MKQTCIRRAPFGQALRWAVGFRGLDSFPIGNTGNLGNLRLTKGIYGNPVQALPTISLTDEVSQAHPVHPQQDIPTR
jgi:hypothetical protein